jgi:RNA recognition motif-containing protein
LPKKASNDTLQEYFEKFGKTVECRIVTDKITQQSRGFAFVTYLDEASFHKAVSCKTHKYLKAVISVKPAMSKNESE